MRPRAFAATIGTSYDRLMKVLRGELIMRLDDVGAAEAVLKDVSGVRLAVTAVTVPAGKIPPPQIIVG